MRLLKHKQKQIEGGAGVFAILGAVAIGINVLVGVIAGAINIHYASLQAPVKPIINKQDIKPIVDDQLRWTILPSVGIEHQLYYQSN